MAEIKKYLDLQVGLPQLVTEIKAADEAVLAAAKKHAEDLGANYDAAGAAATAEKNAKDYADAEIVKVNEEVAKKATIVALEAEAKARGDKDTELQGLIEATDAKAVKNAEDIAAINHAETGILAQAKADATTKANAVQSNLDALVGKVGEVPEGSTVMDIITNIQENAYDDTQLKADIATELDKKADKTQVATDIETAVAAETSARETAVAGVQSAVDTLAGTHATDKKNLEDAIALKADIASLDQVSAVANAAVKQADYDVKVKALEDEDARIAGLVSAEAERAAGIESGLDTRLGNVEKDYLKAADKTELQDQITANANAIELLTEGVDAEKVDGVKDLIDYVEKHGTEVTGIKEDIAKNAEDIAELDERMTTAEGNIEGLQTAVSTKVEQEAYNTKIAALEGVDAGQETRLQALEAKFGEGEGNVEDMIADAVAAGVADAVGQAEAKDSALKTEVKGYTDAEVAKDRERLDALEAIDHEHANKELIDTYTQTEANLADAVAKKHEHANATVLDGITADKVTAWDAAEANAKAEATRLDGLMNARVEALEAIDHDHSNKAELDLIASGDKAKWDEAYAKRHEHANAAELAKVVDGDVAKWNAAEQNAKDFATGLNTTMQGTVDGVTARVKTLEDTIVDKAETSTVTSLAERVTTNETNIAANTAKLNSFVAISAEEVTALFQ